MRRKLPLILAVVWLLSLILTGCTSSDPSDINDCQKTIDEQAQTIQNLEKMIEDQADAMIKLNQTIENLEQQAADKQDSDVYTSSQLPFNTTADKIREDLRSHPELIPFEAVLGGTNAYEIIHVMSREYVYTVASDGHIGADMVLSYQISGDGKIAWKVLVYDLHDGNGMQVAE